MEDFIVAAAHHIALGLEALAILVIVYGSLEAFVSASRVIVQGSFEMQTGRPIWLRFSHWLVAGMTFQVASDVVHTTVAPTWSDIGRLAAITAIRTFISYFLTRDIAEVEEHAKHA